MYQFDVVTLFPEMFESVTGSGVTGRARERKLYELVLWNPRSFAANSYRTVDDRPYGGGPGMVMMAEPLEKALTAARQRQKSAGVKQSRTVYLSPQGRPLDHRRVMEYAALDGLVLLAGRYEGVDERLMGRAVDEEVSIGDYVLTGGELAAMVVMDAVVRQMPGALGDAESADQDSFAGGLLDCPHYTRGRSGAAGAALGQPRRDRALAAEAGTGAHLAAAAGAAGEAGTERRGTEAAGRIQAGELNMDIIKQLEAEEIKRLGKEIPEFSAGDTVVVNVSVVEGDRKRVQAYEGVVIGKRNRGLNSSFIVRKISSGEGVERTFQTYSPLIASIEVKRRGDVGRAKLYYLRERTGKKARIREKLEAGEEIVPGESQE